MTKKLFFFWILIILKHRKYSEFYVDSEYVYLLAKCFAPKTCLNSISPLLDQQKHIRTCTNESTGFQLSKTSILRTTDIDDSNNYAADRYETIPQILVDRNQRTTQCLLKRLIKGKKSN